MNPTGHRHLICAANIVLLWVFASLPAQAASVIQTHDKLNRLTNVTYATGASQTFTYDPAGNRTIRVSVNPLSISGISSQVTVSGTPTATLPFTINNPNVSAANLTVWGKSSNPSLVSKPGLNFGGSGSILKTNFNPAIPCHRVIRSDGTLGSHNRGNEQKRKKLADEGALGHR